MENIPSTKATIKLENDPEPTKKKMRLKTSQLGENICNVMVRVWRNIIAKSTGFLPYLRRKCSLVFSKLHDFSVSLTAKLDSFQTMLCTVQTCQTSGLREMLQTAHQGNGWRWSAEFCMHSHKPNPTAKSISAVRMGGKEPMMPTKQSYLVISGTRFHNLRNIGLFFWNAIQNLPSLQH